MQTRLFTVGLLLSSLVCYLEWGHGNSSFLFQAEYLLLAKQSGESFMHPLVGIPLIGQILLLISVFKKEPSKRLTLIGLSMIGVLVLLILFVGLLSWSGKIAASTIPFILTSAFFISRYRKS